MRRKKHKHTRRTVKFFKIHHGFREPYKVLYCGSQVGSQAESIWKPSSLTVD